MIPSTDLVLYRQQTAQVATQARQAQKTFFYTLDLNNPVVVRDALLEVVPQIVAGYAPIAAAVAGQFYETVRRQQTTRDYKAFLFTETPDAAVQVTVRYAAGNLFTDDPGNTLAVLDGAMQRRITDVGRQTIAGNAVQDPLRPRFARVPSGKCCAFCTVMASRGFVYKSEASAGQFTKFHDHDECSVVPDFSKDPGVDGYDPESMYRQYLSARSAAGSPNINDIAAQMRRQEPDRYTDGVATTN